MTVFGGRPTASQLFMHVPATATKYQPCTFFPAWLAWNGPNTTGRLISNKGRTLNRTVVSRIVKACARIAGIGHVHPHQLRHTLATQSINNGMSLEAIAQMLGHRSMRMTLVYARIADRTVADEYFAAADKVDHLYQSHLTTSPATGPISSGGWSSDAVILSVCYRVACGVASRYNT